MTKHSVIAALSLLRYLEFHKLIEFDILTESAEKLQVELRDLRVQYFTLKELHDDLREKMKFFTKVGLCCECALYFNDIASCFSKRVYLN